ncbi:hypothetical protein A3715_27585 [Oleiphilus sp. HI0009]|nr:hypothetical protein A3715_15500 [Oleiphilus sp. HI0009]KZX85833.1 hypothetical protein A3715_27585 [Oleiphilus sp. HI0009]
MLSLLTKKSSSNALELPASIYDILYLEFKIHDLFYFIRSPNEVRLLHQHGDIFEIASTQKLSLGSILQIKVFVKGYFCGSFVAKAADMYHSGDFYTYKCHLDMSTTKLLKDGFTSIEIDKLKALLLNYTKTLG